jgi:hypothetical protein
MRLSEVLTEAPAVIAATGTQPVAQAGAVPGQQQQAASPTAMAQMQAKAAQDTMQKKRDIEQAIKNKEQELIALRKELTAINSPGSVV